MTSPEKPKSSSEKTQHDAAIDNVRTELAELQAALGVGSSEEVAKEAAEVYEQLVVFEKLTDNKRVQFIRQKLEEHLKNPKDRESLKETITSLNEVLSEKMDLAKEVNANNPDLAAMPGNPEKTNPSFITLALGHVDSILAMAGKSGGGKMKFVERFSGLARQAILTFAEKLASFEVPMLGKFSFLGPADLIFLEEKRFSENLRALDAKPALKDQYEKNAQAFEGKWRAAYSAWVVNQSGAVPTLASVVTNAPIQPATPVATPEQPSPAIFAADEVRKEVAGKEFTTILPGDKKVSIQKNNIVAQLPGVATKTVQIFKGDSVQSIESLERVNSSLVNAADFTIVLSNNAGSVALGSLVTAIEKVNTDSGPVEIAGTSLTITLT